MKKNLNKIATIILLVFSMTLTNFSMIVRAAEPKAQGTHKVESSTTKKRSKRCRGDNKNTYIRRYRQFDRFGRRS